MMFNECIITKYITESLQGDLNVFIRYIILVGVLKYFKYYKLKLMKFKK